MIACVSVSSYRFAYIISLARPVRFFSPHCHLVRNARQKHASCSVLTSSPQSPRNRVSTTCHSLTRRRSTHGRSRDPASASTHGRSDPAGAGGEAPGSGHSQRAPCFPRDRPQQHPRRSTGRWEYRERVLDPLEQWLHLAHGHVYVSPKPIRRAYESRNGGHPRPPAWTHSLAHRSPRSLTARQGLPRANAASLGVRAWLVKPP